MHGQIEYGSKLHSGGQSGRTRFGLRSPLFTKSYQCVESGLSLMYAIERLTGLVARTFLVSGLNRMFNQLKETVDKARPDDIIPPSDPVSWMTCMACVCGPDARLDGIGGSFVDAHPSYCRFPSSSTCPPRRLCSSCKGSRLRKGSTSTRN